MNRRGVANVTFAAIAIVGGFAGGYFMFRTRTAPVADVEPLVEGEPAEAGADTGAFFGAEWNTYHGPGTFTGWTGEELGDSLELLWRFQAGSAVWQTPVVCGGVVYFSTARGEVMGVTAGGELLWSRQLLSGEQGKDGPLHAQIEAPLACFDGLVVAGTMGGMVHALDAGTGVERWKTPIDSPVMGSPNYLKTEGGGRVYVVGRANGVLHCLEASTGRVVWRGEETDRCDGSPSVSADVAAYGSCAAALHVFSPETGVLSRNIELGADSQVAGGVAIDGDWLVTGTRSGAVVQASGSTGRVAWMTTEIEAEVFTTPGLTRDRAVVAGNDGLFYAIDRTSGKVVWRYDGGGPCSSAVIAGGKVVAAANGSMLMLSLDDGRKLWEFKVSDEITGPAVAGGRVFAGSADGTVVAFGARGGAPVRAAQGGVERR